MVKFVDFSPQSLAEHRAPPTAPHDNELLTTNSIKEKSLKHGVYDAFINSPSSVAASGVCGVETDQEGREGTFWGPRNVLDLDRGLGYSFVSTRQTVTSHSGISLRKSCFKEIRENCYTDMEL